VDNDIIDESGFGGICKKDITLGLIVGVALGRAKLVGNLIIRAIGAISVSPPDNGNANALSIE